MSTPIETYNPSKSSPRTDEEIEMPLCRYDMNSKSDYEKNN